MCERCRHAHNRPDFCGVEIGVKSSDIAPIYCECAQPELERLRNELTLLQASYDGSLTYACEKGLDIAANLRSALARCKALEDALARLISAVTGDIPSAGHSWVITDALRNADRVRSEPLVLKKD